MSTSRVARRYSKALVGLTERDKSYDLVAKDLESFVKFLDSNPDVATVLADPRVDTDVKERVLREVVKGLGLRTLTANFLYFLGDRQRIGEIRGILEDFHHRLDVVAGRVRASVTSATALSPLELQRIKASLEKATGRKVVLEARVEPTMLGGVVTRIGNLVLDGSVRSALHQMREQLFEAVQ